MNNAFVLLSVTLKQLLHKSSPPSVHLIVLRPTDTSQATLPDMKENTFIIQSCKACALPSFYNSESDTTSMCNSSAKMSTDQADGIELVILEVIKNILCKVYSLSILTAEGKERKRHNPKGQSLGIFYKLERIFPFPGIQRISWGC